MSTNGKLREQNISFLLFRNFICSQLIFYSLFCSYILVSSSWWIFVYSWPFSILSPLVFCTLSLSKQHFRCCELHVCMLAISLWWVSATSLLVMPEYQRVSRWSRIKGFSMVLWSHITHCYIIICIPAQAGPNCKLGHAVHIMWWSGITLNDHKSFLQDNTTEQIYSPTHEMDLHIPQFNFKLLYIYTPVIG